MKKQICVALGILAMAALFFTGCPDPNGGGNGTGGGTGGGTVSTTGTIVGRAVYGETGADASGIVISYEKTDGALTEEASRSIVDGNFARVAERAIENYSVTTADGKFKISDLEPGMYTVYASSEYSMEKSVPKQVVVRAGETTSNVELKLTPVGSIKGRITLDGKNPEENAFWVSIRGTNLGNALTNADGTFELTGIPEAKETYHIIVNYCGSILISSWKSGVSVTGKATTDLGTMDFKSEDIEKGILKGEVTVQPEKGETGETGAQGDKGETGAQGDKGDKGETGAQGDKGDKGETGAQGEKGEKGDPGKDGTPIIWRGYAADESEIENPVELNAYYNTTDGCSYIYNGNEWELLAKAGEAGAQGEKGETGAIDFLTVDLLFNQYAPDYQNIVTFLDGETQLEAGDTVKLKYKYATDKKTPIALYFVDRSNGKWTEISSAEEIEANTKDCKAGKVVSGTLETTIGDVVPTLDPNSMSLVVNTWLDLPGEVKVTFTEFSIYINDEEYDADLKVVEEKTSQTSIDDQYNIEAFATDRGIKFVTRILSNTGNTASMTFNITEVISGINLVRNWEKSSGGWTTCETYYPFVEAGKTYSFTVSANQGDYTLYKKNIIIEATGGLGEFRIENKDDYDVELTGDRVMRLTKQPIFTDNPKVNILRQASYYELYEADDGNWNWIYSQESWFDKTNGTLSLKDDSDGIWKWKSFENIDACLSGHLYRARARTWITVAGYQDNGQTYFEMGDQKDEVKEWGGEIKKVAVFFAYLDLGVFENLPGENTTITMFDSQVPINLMIMNYHSVLFEPTEVPALKNAVSSEFKGWYQYSDTKITFPFELNTQIEKDEDGNVLYLDIADEKVCSIFYAMPLIEASFNVTFMNGDEELGTETTDFSICGSEIKLKETPILSGYLYKGLYADKELTKAVTLADLVNDNPKLYMDLKPVTELCSGNFGSSVYLDLSNFVQLAAGDTLWFEVQADSSSGSREIYCRDQNYNNSQYSDYVYMNAYETKYFSITLNGNLARNINQYDLYADVRNYYGEIKSIKHEKGPRVNVEFYDGETLLQTVEAVPNESVNYTLPTKEGYICTGLYTDADCTNEWNGTVADEDLKVYGAWIEITSEVWSGHDSEIQGLNIFGYLAEGDTLWFEVQADGDSGYREIYCRDCYEWADYTLKTIYLEESEIGYVGIPLSENLADAINQYGLHAWSQGNLGYFRSIMYVSGRN